MDARSERPATGYGSPAAGLGELTNEAIYLLRSDGLEAG
jgi:hypothetical protein